MALPRHPARGRPRGDLRLPVEDAWGTRGVPQRKLVLVPPELDAAEAVAVVLNYVTAYQMLHRSAKARPGQRMLIHGASGGVGSAMLQLAKLAGVEMYGTCSAQGAAVVRELGGIPIDYKTADFV